TFVQTVRLRPPCSVSVVLLATHGQDNCGSTDNEDAGSGSQAGALGTGARQIGSAVTVSVVVTVVAATVAVIVGNDRERTGQSIFVLGVVGTGDLEIVLAEVGRGVRGVGAIERGSDDSILVRDLVQGDALDVLRSGNDLESDLLALVEAFGRDLHALVLLDEVGSSDLLRVDGQIAFGRSLFSLNGHGELGRCRLLAVLVDDCGVVVVTGFGRCLSGELAVGVRLHGRVAVGGHSLSGACIGLSGLPDQFHLDVRGSLSGDLSAFDDGLVPDLRSFGLLVAIGIRSSFIVRAVSGCGAIRVLTGAVSVSGMGVAVSVGIGLIVLRISVSVGLGLIAIGSRGSICVLTVDISVSVLLCI